MTTSWHAAASALLASLLLMAPAAVGLGFAVLRRERRRRRSRSPIDDTHRLRRPPGTWVRSKLYKLQEDLQWDIFLLTMTSVSPVTIVLTTAVLEARTPGRAEVIVCALAIAGSICWYTRRIVRLGDAAAACKLGLQCELAVAHELDALLRDGYGVYHDVPLDGTNLDHVVVGDDGVVVVETKGRARPTSGDGPPPTTLRVRDGAVMTPGPSVPWADTGPIAQARSGAELLRAHLRDHASIDVAVEAMVVYPGWHVTGGDRGPVPVTSARRAAQVARARCTGTLGADRRRRVEAWLGEATTTLEPAHLVRLPEHA